MKSSMKAALACFGVLVFCAPAYAITFTGTVDYYEQLPSADFGNSSFCNPCGLHYDSTVTGTLGADGRPVYNTGYGGPAITQLNGSGTLAWWNQAQYTGSSSFTTNAFGSYSANIFPTNGTGTSNASAYQTAIFTLSLLANTAYTFTYTGDDDVFVALGNQVISQDGGVHAAGQQINTVTFNSGASNALTIFFADRFREDSSLTFAVEAVAVPGPVVGAGIPGLLMALGGLVAWRRRRSQIAVA
jgi:fibro-slime domain-containing protein